MDNSSNPVLSPETAISSTLALAIYVLLLIGTIVWICLNRKIAALPKVIWVVVVIAVPLIGIIAWAVYSIAENAKKRKELNSPT